MRRQAKTNEEEPKLPALPWYVGDWMKDGGVRSSHLATRGFWFDLLNFMWAKNRAYQWKGTVADFATLVGASASDVRMAIRELRAKRIANVSNRNGEITIVCRRLRREAMARQGNALRQRRHRQSRPDNAPVTPASRKSNGCSSSSSSCSASAVKSEQPLATPKDHTCGSCNNWPVTQNPFLAGRVCIPAASRGGNTPTTADEGTECTDWTLKKGLPNAS